MSTGIVRSTNKIISLAFRVANVDEQFRKIQQMIRLAYQLYMLLALLEVVATSGMSPQAWLRLTSAGIGLGMTMATMSESTEREIHRARSPV